MNEDRARYEVTKAGIELEDGKLPDAENRLNAVIREIGAPQSDRMKVELCSALTTRSTVRKFSNRYFEAYRDLDEAEALASQFPFLPQRNWLFSIYLARAQILAAKYSGKVHDNAAALSYLTKARQMGFIGWAVDELESDIAFQNRDWTKAALLCRRAYEAIAKEGWARGVAALRRRRGEALIKLGQLQEAEAELREALAFFSAQYTPDLLALTQLSLAKLYSVQNKHDVAWEFCRKALENVDSLIGEFRELLSQQQFLIDKLEHYQQAFRIAIAAGGRTGVERAWSVAEYAKSFYLCQLLAASNVALFEGVPPEDTRHLKELESALDGCYLKYSAAGSNVARKQQLESELKSLSAERQTFLSQLMVKNRRWASIRTPGKFEIKEILNSLDSSWELVTYFWEPKEDGAESLFVLFTGKNNELKHKEIIWTQQDLEIFEKYKRDLNGLPYNVANPVIPAILVEKILPPEVLEALEGKSCLLVSPHGRLCGTPLHLTDIGSGVFLFERWQVQYIPSLGLLPLERIEEKESDVLLVASPEAFGKTPLVDAETEIHQLFELWSKKRPGKIHLYPIPSDSSLAELGFDENDWRKFDVLHFACHGDFPADRPFDAALFLGKDALRASEFFALKLNASLVSLSACCLGQTSETYAGVRLVSDEWVGLFLPLFYAGARTILASLWEADSEDAVIFMKDFHGAMSENGSPISAFQQALKLAKERAPELIWGNWYLVGFPYKEKDKA